MDIIQESLIARIEQLKADLSQEKKVSEGHRQRASALETALNNVMSELPEKVQNLYRPVLERNRERR